MFLSSLYLFGVSIVRVLLYFQPAMHQTQVQWVMSTYCQVWSVLTALDNLLVGFMNIMLHYGEGMIQNCTYSPPRIKVTFAVNNLFTSMTAESFAELGPTQMCDVTLNLRSDLSKTGKTVLTSSSKAYQIISKFNCCNIYIVLVFW